MTGVFQKLPSEGLTLCLIRGMDRRQSSRHRCSYVQLGAVSGCSLFASTLGLGNFTMFFN